MKSREKCDATTQATDDNIILHRKGASCMSGNKGKISHANNIYYFLLSHGNSG
jgi:hypothetical protein